MATMIPNRYEAGTSAAEQRVFERLRADPETTGWTVLHSLGLSHRGKKPYGEIDFVVLVPGGGIVCLEVKGGRVTCRDGIWRTQDRQGRESRLSRSPFQQAREGMFALRDALQSHFGGSDDVSRTLVAYAVVFPDVVAPPAGTEFESWECIDLNKLRRPLSKHIRQVLIQQKPRIARAVVPDTSRIERIRNYLRPDFEIVVARATSIGRSEERLLRLTEEQFEFVDLMERNQRCVVEGAAGTGKTVLAMEYARRCAREGRRTVLLCFNRMLGDWLGAQARDPALNGLLAAGSFHRLLRQIIVDSAMRGEFLAMEPSRATQPSFFSDAYPEFAELALLDAQALPEVLIVDEAQDLSTDAALRVMNAWVQGGLAGGRWAMLGDFTRQAIFSAQEPGGAADSSGRGTAAFEQRLACHAPHFASLVLRRNCRNTRPIGEETALLSGFESLPYRLDGQESLAVDYRWFSSRDDEVAILRSVLEKLEEEEVPAEDIVILSPSRFDQSAAALLGHDQRNPVVQLDCHRDIVGDPRRRIGFSTIQAFKGMESPVVILAGIDRVAGSTAESLLYVGMSRARSHLIVLMDDRRRPDVQRAVERKLTAGWGA